MNEATAYKLVGQIFKGFDRKILEIHVCQVLADRVASTLMEVYRVGQQEDGMTDKEFRALLDLIMCSDPWPVCDKHGVVDLNSQLTMVALANKESEKRDYEDCIDAFHLFMKPRAIVGPTPRG